MPRRSTRPAANDELTLADYAFDFVSFVSRAMPLSALLDGFPSRAASLLRAEVLSVYLLEGHGDGLVLRGNVGFRSNAQGTIRLKVGEGLTGLAVKELRAVRADRATGHENFRRFDELDEDRFPVFLAVPILGAEHKPLGAMVAQRASSAFSDEEVLLATTLTAPVAHAVRQAALLDDLRDKQERRTGGGTRKITLPGRPIHKGRAMGAIAALRRPAKDRKTPPRPDEAKTLLAAFDTVEKSLRQLQARAVAMHLVGETSFLETYVLMAGDERLKERALELVRSGKGAAEALSTVAREVTRHARGIVGDPFLEERSRDVEDLVDTVLMHAAHDARGLAPAKAVLITDQLTVFDLLVTARTQLQALVLAGPASPRTEVLARLLDVPLIAEVEGALRWASPGDVALVDADHGFVVLNPSRAEVASLRAWRKRGGVEDEPTP
jgi:phosphotransferase system, enzyme I, PtsP